MTWRGESLCLSEWAERLNIPQSCLQGRLSSGWSVDKAFTTEYIKPTLDFITYNEETLRLYEWADRYDINRSTLKKRIQRGWSIEKALKEPVKKKSPKQS